VLFIKDVWPQFPYNARLLGVPKQQPSIEAKELKGLSAIECGMEP